MANIPVILTIRRTCDGGTFEQGEGARTVLFAKGLAFADTDPRNNFAYIDLENDYHVSSIEESAQAFGTRIIRSLHDFDGPVTNLSRKLYAMCRREDEICKIACMPHSLHDVTAMYCEAQNIKDRDMILVAMGELGLPTRILASRFHSCITYTCPQTQDGSLVAPGQIDPVKLQERFNFRAINDTTRLFAITGNPVTNSKSPEIHNFGYREKGVDAAYIALNSTSVEESIEFAEAVGIEGMSITHPFKHDVLPFLEEITADTGAIGACNTVVRTNERWYGSNTDAQGFSAALTAFLDRDSLRFTKVAIIGAGGAADAIAYAVKQLRGKACIFNRTVAHARELAEKYNFAYAPLDDSAFYALSEYSKVIIQTTSVGMTPNEDSDPIDFYTFEGHESVIDIIYRPAETKMMKRAAAAGCKTQNGWHMLMNQAKLQFKTFTGISYPTEGPNE